MYASTILSIVSLVATFGVAHAAPIAEPYGGFGLNGGGRNCYQPQPYYRQERYCPRPYCCNSSKPYYNNQHPVLGNRHEHYHCESPSCSCAPGDYHPSFTVIAENEFKPYYDCKDDCRSQGYGCRNFRPCSFGQYGCQDDCDFADFLNDCDCECECQGFSKRAVAAAEEEKKEE
ncbi:hypothetical protein BZA05DRAFT_445774 [Tricharina praecox]|uniref:uncharacterized protein n=1 Tax=Tricharina praecox TaxID=43433 RepID=UPI002220D68A|nr:uncharacterized protein BZA05DRAFT_445774 [Tricharina praecox]KAI5850049.1 hypothetical protein BZA05DRAFT_445774 [Tricharina praecox]